MRIVSKHLLAALMGVAVLSSCARQQAYFQPTARESFKTAKTERVAQASPVAAAIAEPVAVTETSPVLAEAPTAAPVSELAQTKQAVSQLDAYVRNDSKLNSSKKLTKRIARLNELMATTSDKAVAAAPATSAKKMSLMERMVLKKMDKKIKNHVAPDQTNAMNSNVRLGLIVGIIGLVLLLLGGGTILGVIGLIGFVVGLVLVLLGVING